MASMKCSKKTSIPIKQSTAPNNININESVYISTLNEFEKSCIPLIDLKNNDIIMSIDNFVNATRAFGMDSSAIKLKLILNAFENLETKYSDIIKYSHKQYESKSRNLVDTTTSSIFQSMHKGISILRIFHNFCGQYNILDKETVRVFLEMTKSNNCPYMAVYVEQRFFQSMNDICQKFVSPNGQNKDVCSTTISYRSSKERLDNLDTKDIEKTHGEIKNFLDNWALFLDIVIVFVVKNYLRLRDQNVSLCLKTFLSQQYQIVLEYNSRYQSYVKGKEAKKLKDNIGLIWN